MKRRDFVKAAACAVPATTGLCLGSDAAQTTGASKAAVCAKPLAQDYTVVDRLDDPALYTDAPSLVKLPDGTLLCAYQMFGRDKDIGPNIMKLFRSGDGGHTWDQTPEVLAFQAGRLFLHGGSVYFLGSGPRKAVGDVHGDMRISRSEDGGETWLPPSVLCERQEFYNPAAGMVISDGRLYWSYGVTNERGQRNVQGSRMVVVAGDVTQDLLDPACWRISNYLTYPGQEALAAMRPDGLSPRVDHWLEGNVVKVGHHLRVINRLRVGRYLTCHIAGICAVEDDGEDLRLRFVQFAPMPGAQNHFHIIRDEVSGLFWTPVNLPTDTQNLAFGRELRPGGAERRILALLYSLDALNWFQAGLIAVGATRRHAFNYTTPLVDGDDLLIVSRTSRDRPGFHDNDLVTFHRVSDFRALALKLVPEA